jgi:hypothetical protein
VTRLLFWSKPLDWVLSLAIGGACMLCLSFLLALFGERIAVWGVMWPGVLLTELFGYGLHDTAGVFLYFGGTVAFYWLLVFALIRWVRRKSAAVIHQGLSTIRVNEHSSPMDMKFLFYSSR